MTKLMNTVQQEDITLSNSVDQQNVSHRQLSEHEAHAIWTMLNRSSNAKFAQELRIVLKPEGSGSARGWVVCTE